MFTRQLKRLVVSSHARFPITPQHRKQFSTTPQQSPFSPSNSTPASTSTLPWEDAALLGKQAGKSPTPPTFQNVQQTTPSTAHTGPSQIVGELNGPKGPEPTRYGDFERAGRCYDF